MGPEAEILQIEHLLSTAVALLISTARYSSVWCHTRILARQKIPSQLNTPTFDDHGGLTWPIS